ncbi:hypothetical protein [Pseudomonas oryzihabitans]|uniref:hypothetical protein n=1 Tax=Pseudomonas oryzihabitans TaxID=47885 RepID=UPI001DF39D7A|nr:hypothetical protein [Pseudomonas oryzihabitans]HJE67219.1 hypothetical protein [Pseudomonas oryzihabitans]
MMQSRLDLHEAYEYDSPVEFVLVATIGRGRAVVAKSKGAGIDLASYAQKNQYHYGERRSSFIQVFYPVIDDLSPLAVDSYPLKNPRSKEYDERSSELTLVWRGKDRPGLIEDVKISLNEIGLGLTEAIESGSPARVEWLLSPVLAKCTEALADARNFRLAKAARFKLMAVTLVGYLLLAAGSYLYLYINR